MRWSVAAAAAADCCRRCLPLHHSHRLRRTEDCRRALAGLTARGRRLTAGHRLPADREPDRGPLPWRCALRSLVCVAVELARLVRGLCPDWTGSARSSLQVIDLLALGL